MTLIAASLAASVASPASAQTAAAPSTGTSSPWLEPTSGVIDSVADGALGSVSGTVTLEDGRPLAGGGVTAISTVTPDRPWASVAEDGSYRIDSLPAGRYTLHFEPGSRRDELADYVPEYWNDAVLPTQADYFDLAAGQHQVGMDARLEMGATISGRITLADGTPMGNGAARVVDRDGSSVDPDYNDGLLQPDGTYLFRGVPPGNWTLQFWASSITGEPYVTEYWGGKPYVSQAEVIDIGARQDFQDMNAELIRGATISGRLTGPDGDPISDAEVQLDSADSFVTGVRRGEAHVSARTDAAGHYTARGLPPGLWHLYFYAPQDSPYRDEWWSDKPWGSGDLIRVLPQATITGKNAALTYASPTGSWGEVSRVAGTDRYGTSVAISASQFAPGVPVAYVASGAAFPDALAAAPVAAGTRGPVLLSAFDVLPDVVADELRRLQPERVVILGGTSTISPTVASRLEAFAPGAVTRLGGPDRYATAVAISKSRFTPGVPVVYIASGTSFPDALSGAPHAGLSDAPVLLTNPDALPAVVVEELKRLRPERIYVLGGGSVISGAVESQLGLLAAGFEVRYSGNTRYETSAVLSSSFDYGVSVAYIANGENFPDALAAGPVAGLTSGPVLLTARDSLPKVIADELKRLRPDIIVILGGSGAVSATVEAQIDALSG